MRLSCKKLFPFVLFAATALSGFNGHPAEKKAQTNERVELYLNQSGADLMKHYPDRFQVSRHPAGLNFYVTDWRGDARGSVVIGKPHHAVTLSYILGATATDDSNFADEQIINWEISAGIGEDSVIGHDEARRRFFGILQALRDAGWKRAIELSQPRLKGKDALEYRKTRASVYSLDPGYVLSLDEWMALKKRTTWSLYTDDAFLDISITPDPSRLDVNKPGAYFVEYSLQAKNEYWRTVVGPNKRLQWKTELPAVLTKLQLLRKTKEEEFKKEHIAIDETYRDPPLPDLNR